MKRSPWVPLDANFQDDDDIVELTAEAELLFVRSIAHAKRLDNGGIIRPGHLRRLSDKFSGDTADLVAELVEVGLWTPDDGRWLIGSFNEWNTSVEEARASKSEAGRIGNHSRWGHAGRFEACTLCNPVDNQEPLVTSSVAERSQSESQCDRIADRKPSQTIHRRDETRRDETKPPPPPPPTEIRDGTDPTDVAVADQLIETLGYLNETATSGERRYVARARARGWTDEHLTDLAHEAAASNADDIRQYLLGCLRKRANTNPDPTQPPPPTGSNLDLDFSDLTGLPADPDAEIAARYAKDQP